MFFIGFLLAISGLLYVGPEYLKLNQSDKTDNKPAYQASSAVLGTSGSVATASADSDNIVFSEITRNIFVIYDGSTYTLTYPSISSFFTDECINHNDWCSVIKEGKSCVNTYEISSYVTSDFKNYLNQTFPKALTQNRAGKFNYRISDYVPEMQSITDGIAKILTNREHKICGISEPGITMTTSIDDDVVFAKRIIGPGTDGKFAEKYIEIDDSQQHVYAWENGQVIMDYGMSGAYSNYAVFGVFKIKEKAEMAWSSIAKKWMPHWMSFYWDPKQQAWFGVHELTIWTDKNGVKHWEPEGNIGKRLSMGCLRLGRQAAPKVYEWARVGMPILIHR